MNTDTIISMCRESFSAYDELWLVSARRDHCDNLIDLGIVCEDDFTVVHTHNDLGRKFKNSKILTPPKISSKSFDGIFSVVDDRIFDEVDRLSEMTLGWLYWRLRRTNPCLIISKRGVRGRNLR